MRSKSVEKLTKSLKLLYKSIRISKRVKQKIKEKVYGNNTKEKSI